jgi:hypothetical protein
MEIKFTIIEKSTKIADSPFYGITEKMSDSFANDLTPVKPVVAKKDTTKDAPAVKPLTTTVDSRKPIITSVKNEIPSSPLGGGSLPVSRTRFSFAGLSGFLGGGGGSQF